MSIYKKLFEAKKEIGNITKDSKNPFFKSNYLSLNGLINAVEPILCKYDLMLLQPIWDGKVVSKIYDISTEGELTESVVSEMQLPNIQDPQKLGSAITYYRRYTLQSLLGLLAQDDDGNTATKQVQKQTVESRKPALTIEQYQKAKNGTKEQIQTVLNKFRMSDDQRKSLESIVKK